MLGNRLHLGRIIPERAVLWRLIDRQKLDELHANPKISKKI